MHQANDVHYYLPIHGDVHDWTENLWEWHAKEHVFVYQTLFVYDKH